jgi:probable phosphoglycerate mutase
MSESFPKKTSQRIMLIRHGETEWSLNGRHTSVTDLPLTPEGERSAAALAPFLKNWNFGLVLCSPRLRARRTCDLVGWGGAAIQTDELCEWNYGKYEGLTTAEIRQSVPGWTVFTKPCPGGETAQDVAARVDRVIAQVHAFGGDTLLVAHAHCLRVLTARWLGLNPESARFFNLETGRWSQLLDNQTTPSAHPARMSLNHE